MSTTPEAAEVDPILARVRLVGSYFTGAMATDKSGKSSKYGFLVGKLLDEAVEEMSEAPAAALQFYMGRIDALMHWVVTGEQGEYFPSDFKAPEALTA